MNEVLGVFAVECPSCSTEYPVDAAKVPLGGVHAICSACLRVFPVSRPPGQAQRRSPDAVPDETPASQPVRQAPPEAFEDLRSLASEAVAEMGAEFESDGEATLSPGQDRFGKRNPEERARHLARVLISDILAYDPARSRESLARGTFRADFEEEISRSWDEYVDQVGSEMAESNPFFDDALRDLLARGEKAL